MSESLVQIQVALDRLVRESPEGCLDRIQCFMNEYRLDMEGASRSRSVVKAEYLQHWIQFFLRNRIKRSKVRISRSMKRKRALGAVIFRIGPISTCQQSISFNYKSKYRHVYHARFFKALCILFVSPSFTGGEDNTPLLCGTLLSTCVPKPKSKGMPPSSR